MAVKFGQGGDLPIVGDWDGDGLDDLGVYRGGTWLLDSDGNRSLDAHDRAFQLEGGGTPVAGDWDGDGLEEVGLYGPTPARQAQVDVEKQ